MKILDHKDTINRRQDERLIIVETAIHRVSCLNRTVLGDKGEEPMPNPLLNFCNF
ncbi:MAG: hypothetical protein V7K97_13440 [Nostoc sp.]|uniref:hypothetical protein n=1 Tax=Nostoc sp. TaxID=1180 RepID=UPI002FF52E36